MIAVSGIPHPRPCTAPVTASAPGRVCLAGESLDWMTGGPSVCATIPQRTWVTAWALPGQHAAALSSAAPIHGSRLLPTPAAPLDHRDPLAHLAAAVRTVHRRAAPLDGTVINAATALPVGAGVSSSAALAVAAVAALLSLATGHTPPVEQVCALARHAEAVELGSGAGWMDFLAVAHGGLTQIRASDPPAVRRLRPHLDVPLILIDTRHRRTTTAVLAGKRARHAAHDAGHRSREVDEVAAVQRQRLDLFFRHRRTQLRCRGLDQR